MSIVAVAVAWLAFSFPQGMLAASHMIGKRISLRSPRTPVSFVPSGCRRLYQHDRSSYLENLSRSRTRYIHSKMQNSNEAVDTSVDVGSNLRHVLETIQETCQDCHRDASQIRLVAVSKTKPVSLIRRYIDAFIDQVGLPQADDDQQKSSSLALGENYVQELIDKIPQLPDYVQWHFIGTLQTNKVNPLVKALANTNTSINRLTVETVSSRKLAAKLNNAVALSFPSQATIPIEQRLRVFIQVNTSGEESKGGVKPPGSLKSIDSDSENELIPLATYIASSECPHLDLVGLMAIGAPGETDTFQSLDQSRSAVEAALASQSISYSSPLELSMGMSDDYPDAIRAGSTNIRVGSTIFGSRL
jgi:PLP dependent protein